MLASIVAPHLYAEDQVPTLGQITVTGQSVDSISGYSEINQDVLDALPQKNSSIAETITLLPRVQIGEEQRTSRNAGEILPPLFSISGGRAYENYFALDGVGQGSLLAPLADNPNALDEVPGHPMRTFVHQDLVDSVTVYDSNIPARYGRFVGGVVDATTRLPAAEFGGRLDIRTTRDSWTSFRIDEDDLDDFNSSDNFNDQPRFTKYDGGIELDIPMGAEMGVLTAYKRIQSDLELKHLGEWTTKSKTLETFFLKYAWAPQSSNMLQLTASHTPSEEDFFYTGYKDSSFTVERGGFSLNGSISGESAYGNYDVNVAYIKNTNSREAPNASYAWRNTDSKNWGEAVGISRSREGGFGDIENSEQSLQITADLQAQTIEIGAVSHALSIGGAFSRDSGEYNRSETAYVHNSSTLYNAVICAVDDPACANGEQYFGNRNIYPSQKQDADLEYFAGYIEDRMSVGPIEFRPGVRISYDNYMKNSNTAHRLAGSWDIFNNGGTLLVGGHNRYYGESLLTYKLREAILPRVREVRSLNPDDTLSDWSFDSISSATLDKYSDLDTPYSDEWNVGVLQHVFDGTFELNYLERSNRNQFAKEKIEEIDGTTYFILNNNGSSEYKSIKAVWERQWLNHYVNINYTHTDQVASNESYDDTFDEEDVAEQVWYDGSVMSTDELPREDFYRKHALTIIYTGRLPYGFTFTNVAKYLGSYETIDFVSMTDEEKTAAGLPLEFDIYAKNKRPDYWVVDWRLDWEKSFRKDQTLVLSLEVNNLFNRTPPSGDSSSTYELGRQLWLGMSYKF